MTCFTRPQPNPDLYSRTALDRFDGFKTGSNDVSRRSALDRFNRFKAKVAEISLSTASIDSRYCSFLDVLLSTFTLSSLHSLLLIDLIGTLDSLCSHAASDSKMDNSWMSLSTSSRRCIRLSLWPFHKQFSALVKFVNKAVGGGITALHMAALNGYADCVQLLLDLHAKMSAVTFHYGTSMDLI